MEYFGLDLKGVEIFKMEEENNNVEGKEKNFKSIAVGLDMLSLIEKVKEKFEKEYGFKPNIIDVTNLIAKRAFENELF